MEDLQSTLTTNITLLWICKNWNSSFLHCVAFETTSTRTHLPLNSKFIYIFYTNVVTFRIEALRPSKVGGLLAVPISRLAAFRRGAENDDAQILAAQLDHVTNSGSGVDFDRLIPQTSFKMWVFDGELWSVNLLFLITNQWCALKL